MNHVDEFRRLKRRIDDRNEIIKDFKDVERKETDRLHKIIDESKDTIKLLEAGIVEKNAQIEKLKDSSLSFMIETAEMRAIIEQQKDELNVLPDNFWDVVSQKDETIKQQKAGIDELNNTIEALDAEVSVRKDGSKVLMKIVGVMRLWHNNETGSANAIIMINDILEHTDYGKLLEE